MNVNPEQLLELAGQAKENAFVPYFGFRVGAALQTAEGDVYTGVNIEGASFGVTMCAERTAFYKAVSDGRRKFNSIAVLSDSEEIIYPCGICRQVMSDFADDHFIIICGNSKKEYVMKTLGELLPDCRIPI